MIQEFQKNITTKIINHKTFLKNIPNHKKIKNLNKSNIKGIYL